MYRISALISSFWDVNKPNPFPCGWKGLLAAQGHLIDGTSTASKVQIHSQASSQRGKIHLDRSIIDRLDGLFQHSRTRNSAKRYTISLAIEYHVVY
jgi:hypothetical protein